MHVADVVDGAADGVQQRGAAAYLIIKRGEGLYVLHAYPVVDDAAFVVEQHGGYIRLVPGSLLLFDHGIETADGISLQTGHGAAAVQDKNELGQVLLHSDILLKK